MLKKLFLTAALIIGAASPAMSQGLSGPGGFGPGSVNPFIINGNTIYYPGLLQIPASASSGANLNFIPGIVPTSPNNGDMWVTTAGLFVEINGHTIGPLAGASSNSLAYTAPLTLSFSGGVATYGLSFDANFAVNGSNQLSLASIASADMLANCTGSSAEPGPCSWNAFANVAIGSTSGIVPYNAAGTWGSVALAGTGLAVSAGNLNLQPAQASTIGGVESIAPLSHEWISYIDTSGVPHQSQPSAADLSNGVSGSGAVALVNSPLLTTPQIAGSSAGYTTLSSANTGATNYTLTLPANTGTLAELNLAQTFTAAQALNLNSAALPSGDTGTVLQLGNANSTASRLEITSAAAASTVTGRRSDGTIASPTALSPGDLIATLSAHGYDGTSWSSLPNGALRIYADGPWTSTSHPTEDCLSTTPLSSTTIADAFCVHQDGGATVGVATGGNQGIGTLNLAGALYNNGTAPSGTGGYVRATSPILVTPALGTPASGVLTNATGYPIANLAGITNGITNSYLAQGGAATIKGNPTSALANEQDFTIQGLSNDASPSATLDLIPIYNHLTGAIENATPAAIAGAVGAVSSVSNSDGTLTISPTTGAVVGSLALGHANTWTAPQAILGVTDGSDAPAGYVGEYICAQVQNGGTPTGCATNTSTAVALTVNTPTNITSISLSAGDWRCAGNTGFVPAASTTIANTFGWISTTSATIPTGSGKGAATYYPYSYSAGNGGPLYSVGELRVSTSAPITVYLGAQANFGTSTLSGYGFISCTRMR